MNWAKEARDQLAHIATGIALVQAAKLAGADIAPLAGAAICFGAGLVREFTEWQCARAERNRFYRWGTNLRVSDWSAWNDGLDAIPRGLPWSWGSIRDYLGWIAAGLIGAAF